MSKKNLVLLLSLALVLGISSIDIFLPSLPVMARDFSASLNCINLTISALSLGLAVSCPFCGYLSDYFGRRPIYITAIS